MKKDGKELEKKQLLFALLIGLYCGCAIFLSLTAVATPENSEAILADKTSLIYNNQAMLFLRTLYLSFSSDRIKTTCTAIVIAAIIYISRRIYMTKWRMLSFALVSLLFAAGQLTAKCYKTVGSWELLMETPMNQTRVWIKGIAYGLLCYYLLKILYQLLADVLKQENLEPYEKKKWAGLRMMGCMLICWLPYFVLFYPGTSNEDTVIQLMEYFHIPSYIQSMSAVQGPDIYITNHHPYLLTVLFSSFVKFGLNIGNICAGVALYTVLHMIFLSGVFSGCLQYLCFCGVNRRRIRCLLLLLMLFPIFPLYSVCMVKDTLYASFCLIYMMLMHSVARTKGAILSSAKFHAALFVTGMLMMLTKVYGMYILIIVGVVYLWKYRRYFKQILVSIGVPIFLYKCVYLSLLLPALNVAPGGVQEALSVPFQQTARYVSEYGDEVTNEEQKAINKILPYKKLTKLYNPELSDPVKKKFKQDATGKDMRNYFKVWFQMFLKRPGTYVEATLNNTYQYYDINKISELEYYQFNDYLQKHDKDQIYSWLYIENIEAFAPARYGMKQFVMFLEKVPFLNILISMGYFPWMLLFLLLFHVFQKREGMNIALLIPVITYAICMVSPDNGNSRYIMPIIFSLPYIFLLELLPGKENNNISDDKYQTDMLTK